MTQTLAAFVAGQVRAEMARREITKADLARTLGVNETWIGKRIRGRTSITIDDLERIAHALDLPVALFLPAPASERVA